MANKLSHLRIPYDNHLPMDEQERRAQLGCLAVFLVVLLVWTGVALLFLYVI
jgi:hypothetical protein